MREETFYSDQLLNESYGISLLIETGIDLLVTDSSALPTFYGLRIRMDSSIFNIFSGMLASCTRVASFLFLVSLAWPDPRILGGGKVSIPRCGRR